MGSSKTPAITQCATVWLMLVAASGVMACQSCDAAKSAQRSVAPIVSVSAAPSGPNASRSSIEAMTGPDPGRCVKDVIVGGNSICFEFNRDYYWCRGGGRGQSITLDWGSDAEVRRRNSDKPYNVIPYHFASLYMAGHIGCGMDSRHRLFCWGDNSAGIMPAPKDVIRSPVLMGSLPTPVDETSVFSSDYCARIGDAVWCSSGGGRLPVKGLGTHINALGMGSGLGCAANEREVWCWSVGKTWAYVPGEFEPGPGMSAIAALPISLPEGLRIKRLQVGLLHACVLGEDGGVYCFGEGKYGSWGTGERPACNFQDVPDACIGTRTAHFVETLGRSVKQLAVNGAVSCALRADGSVWCWGNNLRRVVSNSDNVIEDHGEKFVLEPLPKQRTELGHDNRRLLAGVGHACVEKNDGSLWCWGGNEGGQFGGAGVRFIAPQPIELPAPRCKP